MTTNFRAAVIRPAQAVPIIQRSDELSDELKSKLAELAGVPVSKFETQGNVGFGTARVTRILPGEAPTEPGWKEHPDGGYAPNPRTKRGRELRDILGNQLSRLILAGSTALMEAGVNPRPRRSFGQHCGVMFTADQILLAAGLSFEMDWPEWVEEIPLSEYHCIVEAAKEHA